MRQREDACRSLCSRLEGASKLWQAKASLQYPDKKHLSQAMYNKMAKAVFEGLAKNHRESVRSDEAVDMYNAHSVALQTAFTDDEKACRLRVC